MFYHKMHFDTKIHETKWAELSLDTLIIRDFIVFIVFKYEL